MMSGWKGNKMKCKICNGTLSIVDGICICTSCGNKSSLDDYFENIDVYICYIDNDENGRRTKDSIISQDIYRKFEAKKSIHFTVELLPMVYLKTILKKSFFLHYIGQPGTPFYIEDVLVIPNATAYGNTFIPWGNENNAIIKEDTPVLILTEKSVNATLDNDSVSFDDLYNS